MAEIISVGQVKKFILDKQGLRTENPPQSILDLIKKIHNVQIDTISVVARSQDLILYNRLTDYKEKESKMWIYILGIIGVIVILLILFMLKRRSTS